MYYKHMFHVFKCLCMVDYDIDKYMNASTFTYNKVMRLLELANVVEGE